MRIIDECPLCRGQLVGAVDTRQHGDEAIIKCGDEDCDYSCSIESIIATAHLCIADKEVLIENLWDRLRRQERELRLLRSKAPAPAKEAPDGKDD